jgi:pyruvate kinase
MEKIDIIRSISEELRKPVAILQDLCGLKIRVGNILEPGVYLRSGQSFVLTNRPVEGDEKQVSVSYSNLPSEVKQDDRILLADGMMELVVKSTSQTDIFCEVITGGLLTSHKGINLPTGTIMADAMTNKDREDLIFGINNDVDYVALSFVKSAQDIMEAKELMKQEKRDTPVIAKIERHEALDNIEEIMDAADGIMVARGDLGVEIPLENVPNIQKKLVASANAMGKPVIIATQMLRSMVEAPRPTRAEATDVANAVLDGADALMLSEETASGNYPVEAVQYMVRIIESTEKRYPHKKYLRIMPRNTISDSVSHVSCILADNLNAAAIIATTRSGSTAMNISRFKPKAKIIALSPSRTVTRKLSLYWGCIPSFLKDTRNTDEMIENAVDKALAKGEIVKGELAVITTGHPMWTSGTTNMLRVIKL